MQRQVEVDLRRGSVTLSEPDPRVLQLLLGGRGLAGAVLYHALDRDIPALGPGNVLVLANGSLAGSAAPGATRLHIAARSPQTGLLGFANVGGTFGAALARYEIGMIAIREKSPRPVFLYVGEEGVQIREADSLWGLDTEQSLDKLAELCGGRARILTIGPAGENLVPISTIRHGRHCSASRSGMGAVMGSKNLKAVVVQAPASGGRVAVKDQARTASQRAAVKRYVRLIKRSPRYERFSTMGVPECSLGANRAGVLGIRNFTAQQDDRAERISGEAFHRYVRRYHSCYRCPVHCKADLTISEGQNRGYEGIRPEWESISALGYKCGLFDAEALTVLSDLCNRLGIDTVSSGSILAFAIDLYKRGIITAEDTGGVVLDWGDAEAMQRLLLDMSARRGFGAILCGGVRNAARLIGRGAERFAYHVKGLEMSATDPRSDKGLGLGYSQVSRGADFNNVYTTPQSRWSPERGRRQLGTAAAVDRRTLEGKEHLLKRCMTVGTVVDCLGICKIPAMSVIVDFDLKAEAELSAAVCGRTVTPSQLFEVGERVLHLERLINLKLGAGAADEELPEMFYSEPVPAGPNQGQSIEDYAAARLRFYDEMGWDALGAPSAETLESCGLASVLE